MGRATSFHLEATLLNGQNIDPILDKVTPQSLGASPLLLKRWGELRMRQGRLGEAKLALEKAVKGFAGQASSQRLLAAMSSLARAQVYVGSIREAVTTLTFLRDEVERNPAEADGSVYYALAQGAHLIRENEGDAEAESLYNAALRCFKEEGDQVGFIAASFDKLRMQYFRMEAIHWLKQLNHYIYTTESEPSAQASICLLRAMDDFYCARWEEATQHVNHVEKNVLQGEDYRMLLIAQGLRLKLALLSGNVSVDLRREIELFCSPEDHLLLDLESRFIRESVRFVALIEQGDTIEAGNSRMKLETIIRLGLPATYQIELDLLLKRTQFLPRLSASNRNGATGASTLWKIECFKGLRFTRKDLEISHIRWKRKKTLELLLFLLTRPQYTAPKEWIIEELFGDSDSKRAANQLYVAIHQLKSVLRENFGVDQGVAVQGGTIRLQDDWIQYVDLEKYVTLVRVGNQLWIEDSELSAELYSEAVQMYAALLPEIQYIDWLDRLREQLSEYQIGMLRRLGQKCVERDDLERALHYYTQWVNDQPLHEEAYQGLLKVLMRLGRRAEANAWYSRLEDVYKLEMDAVPSPETKEILATR